MIHRERIRPLNNETEKSRDYILYWMQASQRSEYNHALEYAIDEANARNRPLVVFFGLTERFPEANERHYAFMLEGLKEVGRALEDRGIPFVVGHESLHNSYVRMGPVAARPRPSSSKTAPPAPFAAGGRGLTPRHPFSRDPQWPDRDEEVSADPSYPATGAIEMTRRACLVIVDRGYLRIERSWRSQVAQAIDCPLVQVESNVVVPLEQASPKEEYAARTIRPRIHRQLEKYLVPLRPRRIKKDSLGLKFESFALNDVNKALARLNIDRSVRRVSTYIGGTSEAKRRLSEFVRQKLALYPEKRNDPNLDAVSHMSPYLHFGQVSPLYIALEVKKSRNTAADTYLEELIVRRELSMNFVYYNRQYDRFEGLPSWAQKTLKEHQRDRRKTIYALSDLEEGRTGDSYWNAAQREMIQTGKMHNYMRMYWGKRILEWTKTPEEAFRTALYLNNKYEIDGRDANGFTGVAWCFGKHDRPWPTHKVFGKVRIMTSSGLRRKFDADAYAKKYEVQHG
jgi:deoxyribodipyrimidine photo-lyase